MNTFSFTRATAIIYSFCLAFLGLGCNGCEDPKPPTEPPPGPGSILLVANALGAGNMTIVDIETPSVHLAQAGLGTTPNHIMRAGSRIYVINSGSHDMNVLELSDQNTLTQVDTVDLGRANSRNPYAGDLADNGSFYISNWQENTVTALDAATLTPGHLIFVGESPEGVLAYDDKVFVCISGFNKITFEYAPGTVMVISTVSDRVIDTIAVGLNPQAMSLDGAGNIHVVCTGDFGGVPGEVYVIDIRTLQVTRVIAVGGTPGDIAVAGTMTYLAAGGFDEAEGGFVYRYVTATGQILNGPQTDNPIHVALNAAKVVAGSDGSVYVACFNGDRVDHIVGETVQHSWSVGDGPAALLLVER